MSQAAASEARAGTIDISSLGTLPGALSPAEIDHLVRQEEIRMQSLIDSEKATREIALRIGKRQGDQFISNERQVPKEAPSADLAEAAIDEWIAEAMASPELSSMAKSLADRLADGISSRISLDQARQLQAIRLHESGDYKRRRVHDEEERPLHPEDDSTCMKSSVGIEHPSSHMT